MEGKGKRSLRELLRARLLPCAHASWSEVKSGCGERYVECRCPKLTGGGIVVRRRRANCRAGKCRYWEGPESEDHDLRAALAEGGSGL